MLDDASRSCRVYFFVSMNEEEDREIGEPEISAVLWRRSMSGTTKVGGSFPGR